jgi:2-keto-4-pentenoate hydratase/2-oxohepta-3-ene-1,7-dioic acid hydratase in catechol pathway
MKLATFHHQGHAAVGLVDAEGTTLWPLDDLLGRPAGDMNQVIRDFGEISAQLVPSGTGLPLASVRLAAPIPRPLRNVFCVGKNYFDHAHEFAKSGFDSSAGPKGSAVPEAPIIFTKPPETVIADGEAVRYPLGVSDSLDYEAELAVIIGTGGRSIPRDRAFEHVWGYTIINDVTARDLQARHKQWFLGKSMDTFCPMGPWLVTADAVDATNMRVRCWVNDELRQDANTRDLIFDIPFLIETLSAGLTLQPGDIIATGTPAGVGIGFTPPRFLRPGDRVAIEIEGIGRLENPIA